MNPRRTAFPFLALGIAFVVLGLTTNRTFFYVGFIFVFAGLLFWARARR